MTQDDDYDDTRPDDKPYMKILSIPATFSSSQTEVVYLQHRNAGSIENIHVPPRLNKWTC